MGQLEEYPEGGPPEGFAASLIDRYSKEVFFLGVDGEPGERVRTHLLTDLSRRAYQEDGLIRLYANLGNHMWRHIQITPNNIVTTDLLERGRGAVIESILFPEGFERAEDGLEIDGVVSRSVHWVKLLSELKDATDWVDLIDMVRRGEMIVHEGSDPANYPTEPWCSYNPDFDASAVGIMRYPYCGILSPDLVSV